MSRDQCQSHDACFSAVGAQLAGLQSSLVQHVEGLDKTMRENADRLNRLLERSEQWMVQTTTALNEIAAIKQDLVDLRQASDKQWTAINGIRRTVYIGVGVALTASTLLPAGLMFFG